MLLKDVLEKSTQFFKQKQFPSARLDAELLIAEALKLERIQLYLQFERLLNETETSAARELVRRRGLGEPVAYILGRKDFFGSSFVVDKSVLIPRPETEELVEFAIKFLKTRGENPQVLDLGSGSGCIGLTIAKNFPTSNIICVDKSPEALAVARRNAENLGVIERAQFVLGDATSPDTRATVLSEADGRAFDAILANPPYIAPTDPNVEPGVKANEPSMALFSSEEGFGDLKSWSENWKPLLAPGGLMAMEMGATQGSSMLNHFKLLGLENVETLKDLSGLDRIIKGVASNG